jgi:BMFP domain-containing protein YqiC
MDIDYSELEMPVSEDLSLKLGELVADYDAKKKEIIDTEKRLKALKENIKELEMTTIPDLMTQIGTNVFGIPDTDRECRIKPYYHATFPKDNVEDAVKWLENNQLDGVIKNTLVVEFPKGSAETAKQIQQRVHQMMAEYDLDIPVTLNYGAHWKTYTAMVKEQHEAGVSLPLGLLNATIGQIATITKRK